MKKKSEEPEQLHKKQTQLQVLLPVIAAAVICLVVCVFLLVSTSAAPQSTEKWAQISTMFLILPALFLGLACLVVLIFLGSYANKWNNTWPPFLKNARLIIIHFEKVIQGWVQKTALPLIGIKSAFAGFKSLFKK